MMVAVSIAKIPIDIPQEIAVAFGELTILFGILERMLLISIRRIRDIPAHELIKDYSKMTLGKIIKTFEDIVGEKNLSSIYSPLFFRELKELNTDRVQGLVHCFVFVGEDENYYTLHENSASLINIEGMKNTAKDLKKFIQSINIASLKVSEVLHG